MNNNAFKPFNENNVIPPYICVNANKLTFIIKKILNGVNLIINRPSLKKGLNITKGPYNEAQYNNSFNQELVLIDFNKTNTYEHDNTPHNN